MARAARCVCASGWFYVSGINLARRRVDDRHRRPGPVDLHDPSRLVPDAAHDAFPHGELAVALAEPVVRHRWLAPRGARVPVLRVQPPERHPVAGELPVHALPVRVGVDVAVADLLGEERLVGLGIAHRLRLDPADAALARRFRDGLDAVLRHGERPCDRAPRHSGLQQAQDLPRLRSSRHVVPPVFSGTWREDGSRSGAEAEYRRC